jgi:hypothetical protein
MRAAAGVRRATLVLTIGFLAAGTAMLIPACAVPAAHDATSRPRHSRSRGQTTVTSRLSASGRPERRAGRGARAGGARRDRRGHAVRLGGRR